MRRILLLLLAGAAVLALPLAAAARAQSHSHAPGFLVVRNASTDGGVTGKPVATVVVHGFVVGRIAQEGKVRLYPLFPSTGSLAQAAGVSVTYRKVIYHGRDGNVPGSEFSGSDFRFRAVGGDWRVVVYGAKISLYAGAQGGGGSVAHLHGSVFSPRSDGVYSFNGRPFVSLPSGVVTVRLGQK